MLLSSIDICIVSWYMLTHPAQYKIIFAPNLLKQTINIYLAGYAEEYKLPYYEYVSNDPSFDEMRQVVVHSQKRPIFPDRLHTDMVSPASVN